MVAAIFNEDLKCSPSHMPFYSHKGCSFLTFNCKQANVRIIFIITFSFFYNSNFFFIKLNELQLHPSALREITVVGELIKTTKKKNDFKLYDRLLLQLKLSTFLMNSWGEKRFYLLSLLLTSLLAGTHSLLLRS